MAPASSRPELLVIVGETASGKSDMALRVAKQYDGEVIAADSWTVYKGFDIGTSKPTAAQQKAVRHHLLDIREADQGFNAPLFKELAEKAITDIQIRGKLPILVGGTGLYIDSVLYDFGFLPDVSKAEREKLNSLSIAKLLELAVAESIDLSDVDTRNKRRIIRAIEARGAKPTKKGLRPKTLIVGLKIGNEELRKRVEQRTGQMIKAGLEQEVRELSDKYGWKAEPLKGIGYREWQDYLEGNQTLDKTKNKIISATMGLAKRQRTWLKRSPDIQWFSSIAEADSFIRQALNT